METDAEDISLEGREIKIIAALEDFV